MSADSPNQSQLADLRGVKIPADRGRDPTESLWDRLSKVTRCRHLSEGKMKVFIYNAKFSGKARLPPAMDLTASRTKDRRKEKSAAVLKEILLGGGGSIMQQRPETVKLRPKNR